MTSRVVLDYRLTLVRDAATRDVGSRHESAVFSNYRELVTDDAVCAWLAVWLKVGQLELRLVA